MEQRVVLKDSVKKALSSKEFASVHVKTKMLHGICPCCMTCSNTSLPIPRHSCDIAGPYYVDIVRCRELELAINIDTVIYYKELYQVEKEAGEKLSITVFKKGGKKLEYKDYLPNSVEENIYIRLEPGDVIEIESRWGGSFEYWEYDRLQLIEKKEGSWIVFHVNSRTSIYWETDADCDENKSRIINLFRE